MRDDDLAAQSAARLAAQTTLPHFAVSSARNLPKSVLIPIDFLDNGCAALSAGIAGSLLRCR
jgi:hypothetical protein